MKILMVAAEYAPLAKTGGLADAVAGLGHALLERGHDVRVLLPAYPGLPGSGRLGPEAPPLATVAASTERGPCVYLVPGAFPPSTQLYTGDERDAVSFIRLARGALELPAGIGWQPELLHCHDWHAALVPALLHARGPAPQGGAACLLTLHNIGYQGIFADRVLAENGCPEIAELRDDPERERGLVNFLKLGIRYADAVSTVSPTYAREIQRPEYGAGLDDVLGGRGGGVKGILNGVDYRSWSPESDPFLDTHYTRSDPSGKLRVKAALSAELGLPADGAPLIGVVTRLVWQKGIDLLAAALPALLARTRARFALLGSGEAALERSLEELAARHPRRIAFRGGYDEALAHRILAGSDFVLVPSRYEPCGLTQLYALRYGTVPIVRATGGLADTVRRFDPATGAGNGSVFEHADASGIVWGVTTALGWFADATAWPRVVENAMRADFSWAHQAPEYEALYERLTAGRGARS